MTIPQKVVEKDHQLEGRSERSTFDLAKYRWEQTLDPMGPRFSVRAYAKGVGRGLDTVLRHANGYALFVERGGALTIQDAVRLAGKGAEQRAFAEAIAEGSGEPVARVARGDNRQTREIVHQAEQRAERRGTNPVNEAREIARRQSQTWQMEKRHRSDRAERVGSRFIAIEGHLAAAKQRLTTALREGQDVNFSEEEMELIRTSVANIKAVLNLLDMRMAGTPDIDWDAELVRLGGES